MRARLGLLLCLLAACPGCRAPRGDAVPPVAEPVFELSAEDLRLAAALAAYGEAVLGENVAGPDDPATLRQWEQAAALDPGQPLLALRAAALHFQTGDYARAAALLESARARNPRQADVRLALGMAYAALGRPRPAAGEYRAALRIDPSAHAPYVQLAEALFQDGAARAARRALREGLRRAENKDALASACVTIGRRLAAAGGLADAIACYDLVPRHDPSRRADFEVLYAALYQQRGDARAALRHLRRAVRARPPSAEAFLWLADASTASDAEGTLALLRRGEALLPHEPRLPFAAALIMAAGERFEEAIPAFQRAAEIAAGTALNAEGAQLNDRFYYYYGMALERTGRFDQAAALFKQGLALYPDSHEMLNYLAYMRADAGVDLEDNLVQITRALELDPANGAYVDTLGWVYFRLNRYADALRELTRAGELLPDDPTVMEHIGDVQAATGDNARAAEYWRRSLELDPSNAKVAAKLRELGIDAESAPRDMPPPTSRAPSQPDTPHPTPDP